MHLSIIEVYLNGLTLDIMNIIFKQRQNNESLRISTYLNIRIPKQKGLVLAGLHIELVNFGNIFLKKLEIQLHFLS